MKRWIAIISLCFFGLLASPGKVLADEAIYIDVLVGSLQDPTELEILKKTFFPLITDPNVLPNSGVKFRIISVEAKTLDAIDSLRNPQVLGVIWIGHPALTLVGDEKDPTIANSFIKGADGRYLPKNILSAAHSQLKFFGLVTCHSPDVSSRYQPALPKGAEMLTPTGLDFSVEEGKNPAFVLTSLYLGPRDLLEQIKLNIIKWSASFVSNNTSSTSPDTAQPNLSILSIRYADLLSKSFDYTISIDGKAVGTLKASGGFNASATWEKNFSSDILKPGAVIEIAVDDPLRKTASPGPKLDDIVIVEIKVTQSGKTWQLLSSAVHLGDEDENPDASIGLNDTRNANLFKSAGAAVLTLKVSAP